LHVRGPATAKALSKSDERRVAGTTRADDDTAVDGATLLQQQAEV